MLELYARLEARMLSRKKKQISISEADAVGVFKSSNGVAQSWHYTSISLGITAIVLGIVRSRIRKEKYDPIIRFAQACFHCHLAAQRRSEKKKEANIFYQRRYTLMPACRLASSRHTPTLLDGESKPRSRRRRGNGACCTRGDPWS